MENIVEEVTVEMKEILKNLADLCEKASNEVYDDDNNETGKRERAYIGVS